MEWTVEDIKKAQRDFSYNFMRLDCIRTESYDVAIDCMTECIEKKDAEWLRELLAYRKIIMCANCRHYVSGTTHFGECHVTSDIEPTVVCVNETGCDRFIHKDYKEEK